MTAIEKFRIKNTRWFDAVGSGPHGECYKNSYTTSLNFCQIAKDVCDLVL